MHWMITTNLIISHAFIFRGVSIIVTKNDNLWYLQNYKLAPSLSLRGVVGKAISSFVRN